MTGVLLVAIVVMIFIVIFQIAKASEYVSVLKGEEKTRKQNNKINAFLLIAFLVLGLIAGGVTIFFMEKPCSLRVPHQKWAKRLT